MPTAVVATKTSAVDATMKELQRCAAWLLNALIAKPSRAVSHVPKIIQDEKQKS